MTPDGTKIVVNVSGVDQYGEVRIAIEAPRDVEILRGELRGQQRSQR
jgi:sRNA-binding carbon storage regulator CsrA